MSYKYANTADIVRLIRTRIGKYNVFFLSLSAGNSRIVFFENKLPGMYPVYPGFMPWPRETRVSQTFDSFGLSSCLGKGQYLPVIISESIRFNANYKIILTLLYNNHVLYLY